MGAVETLVVDAREEFASDFVAPAIRANALYGGGYPLFTALARPLIARLAVDAPASMAATRSPTAARARETTRYGSIRRSPPSAPSSGSSRRSANGRWAGRRRSPTPARTGSRSRAAPRSRPTRSTTTSGADRRRAVSIEDIGEPVPDDVFQLVTRPEEAPDEPELVRIGFEAGRPVSVDGEELGLVELIDRVSELGRRHGVGIVDHIEDRIVGLKVRDIYEVPAATILLAAHKDLEKLVSTIHQNNFKATLDNHWAYLCYAGLWYEPLRERSRRLHGSRRTSTSPERSP